MSVESLSLVPIGGITPMTTIDYPGKLSAVLYTKGCPWKCHYCYNTELLPYNSENILDTSRIDIFLNERKHLLDAIVLCGGEPTSHTRLPEFISKIKEYGYLVGLHTNGVFPKVLATVLPLVDWVAMDFKAPIEKYDSVTGTEGSAKHIEASIDAIINSGVHHEFRTTIHSTLLNQSDLSEMAQYLSNKGAKVYALQNFQNVPVLNKELNQNAHEKSPKEFFDSLSPLFDEFIVR